MKVCWQKRLLAIVMTVAMVVGMLPASVLAVQNNNLIVGGDFEGFSAASDDSTEWTLSQKGSTVAVNGTATLPTGWKVNVNNGSGYFAIRDNEGVDGSQCLQITLNDDDTADRLTMQFASTSFGTAIEAGNTYVVSMWVKGGQTGAKTYWQVQCSSATSTWANPQKGGITVTTEWQEYSFEFTVPEEAPLKTNLIFVFGYQSTAASGTLFFDNISLMKKVDATAISIPETAELEAGATAQLTATLTPAESSTKVVWSSDNTDVVTVSQTGKITAVAAGSATITATAGSVSDTCTVTVTGNASEIVATGISVNETAEVEVGATAQLTATLTPGNATTEVVWTSDDDTVVSVDQTGKITGVATGTATITATAESVYDTCVVTVNEPKTYPVVVFQDSFENGTPNENTGVVSTNGSITWNGATQAWSPYLPSGSVILDGLSAGAVHGENCVKLTPSGGRMVLQYFLTEEEYGNLKDGAVYSFKAWVKGENCTFTAQMQAVHITSGNPSGAYVLDSDWQEIELIFTVDKSSDVSRGNLKLAVGMSASGTGVMYIDNVSLTRVADATDISFEKDEYYLQVGSDLTLVPDLLPEDAITHIEYTSSDPAVTTVDVDGKVTAVAPGEATIIALAKQGNVSASCKIIVVEQYVALTGITIDVSKTIAPGGNAQLSVTYLPENATETKATWVSDNPAVVSVDSTGILTAIKAGTANITVTVAGISKTCTVTVVADDSYAPRTESKTVDFGSASSWELSQILSGASYTLLSSKGAGKVTLNGSTLTYSPYVWSESPTTSMINDTQYGDFINATFSDQIIIGVKNAEGKSSTITLDIQITSFADLFYDEQGNWITEVDLITTEERLTYIRSQLSNTSSPYYDQLQLLIAQMDQKLDNAATAYNKPNYGSVTVSYDTDTRDTGDVTVNFLMLYLLTKGLSGYETKNARYLEETIEWVTYSLQYPFWGTLGYQNDDLAAGQQLFSCAMVYHFLKDELKDRTVTQIMGTDGSSEEAYNNTVKTYENQSFLEALEMRLWQAGSDMYAHRVDGSSYVGNHQHVRMGGLMAAATALREQENLTDEQKTELMKWTATAVSKIGYGMNSLQPDGTSQEGFGYWEYGSDWMIKTGLVARASLGIDLFELTDAFKYSAEYILYNLLPSDYWTSSSSSLKFGDSPGLNWYGPSQHLRFIAAEYDDAMAQWLAEKVEQGGINSSNASIWMGILTTDETVEPVAPSYEETLRVFEDLQIAIGRTDWSDSAQMMAMKCGLPMGQNAKDLINSGAYDGRFDAGHSHTDANHVVIYANGEFLLWDDGNTNKQTSNHNTLLVDGKGQMGEGAYLDEKKYLDTAKDPCIKIAESNDVYDYLVGDATGAYDKSLGLELFERNVLWLKDEQVMLVVDNVRTNESSDLEIRWLPEVQNIYYSGGVYVAEGEKNTMNFYAFTDETTTALSNLGITSNRTRAGYQQTYTGSQWQNAVAFSWDSNEGTAEPAFVRYLKGEGSKHQFEVNGKIYTIDVSTNEVTITEGELNIPDDNSASDSSISTIMVQGTLIDDFDPAVTSYTVDRWWKIDSYTVEAYANAYGADIVISEQLTCPGVVKITCTSRDGTSTTEYTVNITNDNNILNVMSATPNITREDQSVDITYDGYLASSNIAGKYWTVKLTEENPTLKVVFDLGALAEINKFDMAIHNSRRRDHVYSVYTSVDGETWVPYVVEATSLATEPLSTYNQYFRNIFEDQAIEARYVMVEILGYGDSIAEPGIFVGINEVTFYGRYITEESGVLGDINEDGAIDLMDAMKIVSHYNAKTTLTAEELSVADVNGDGVVDMMDAMWIVAYYNGKRDGF